MLERVKKITGKNSDKDLAELLGLKQGNFSARKQKEVLGIRGNGHLDLQ